MNKLWASVLPIALVLMAAVHVFAQQAPPAPALQLFPIEDLKPGMKGTARTVFSGSEAQEFGVEVLGVLPGFPGPRQSAIIARLSGPNVDKTGVFAGMSGSPVYIDGKLKCTLRGDRIVAEFIELLNKYVESHYSEHALVRS